MRTNNIINKLLKDNRTILQAVHNLYDFDFEKDFNVAVIENESVTINKVNKLTGGSACAVVLMYGTNWNGSLYTYRGIQSVYPVLVKENNFEILTHDYMKTCNIWGLECHWFNTKAAFEDNRKKNVFSVVLWSDTFEQKKINRCGFEYDVKLNRFKFVNHGQNCDNYICIDNAKTISRSTGYYSNNKIKHVLDKSGYFISDKRNKLAKEVQELKKQRSKEAFKNYNYEQDLKNIELELKKVRKLFSNKVLELCDCESIEKTITFYGFNYNYKSMFHSYELLVNKLKNNEVESMTYFNKLLDDFYYHYNNVCGILNPIE